jgi:hypothetical protein
VVQREGVVEAERLERKLAALGQQFAARGQGEAFAVPMIDAIRPRAAQRVTGGGRPNRIIADLRATLRMRRHRAAEMPGQHLRAEADSEKRPLLRQRHRNPVDLAPDVIVRIVGAHRAAEDHRACMIGKRARQLIAKARAANVK